MTRAKRPLHAEIVRRGPYAYVADLGLSRNGTRVNGRPVGRRVLGDSDVVAFGAARCRVGGLPREVLPTESELRRPRRARADPPRAGRADRPVGARAVRRCLRGPGHRTRGRGRPRRHRGCGRAAPAAPVPEVPDPCGLNRRIKLAEWSGWASSGRRPAVRRGPARGAAARRQEINVAATNGPRPAGPAHAEVRQVDVRQMQQAADAGQSGSSPLRDGQYSRAATPP